MSTGAVRVSFRVPSDPPKPSTVRIYWREATEEGQLVSEWTDVVSYSYASVPGCLLFATPTARNVVPLAAVQQIQHTGEI